MTKITMSKLLRTLGVAAAFAGPVVADAAEIRPLFKAGYDFGGDDMVRVVFTDGSSETIKTNEGLYLGGGAAIINDARNWEFHVTLAYKFAMINASNGDVEWTMFPLEALAFYRFQKIRLGGGLAYHINPSLEGSGVIGGLDVKFKNAAGAVLQADWRITEQMAAGLRYTVIDYEAKGAFTGSTKSEGLGLTFSFNF
jgi:hypothetical protein